MKPKIVKPSMIPGTLLPYAECSYSVIKGGFQVITPNPSPYLKKRKWGTKKP
jgi:hypothetical protein